MTIVPPPVSEKMYHSEERRRRARLVIWVRAALVIMALALVVVFAVAIALDPYQDGKLWLAETHRQLGLPQCTFKKVTGYPCPSCGMTSSFALAIRGDLWHSAQANFAGTLLAVGCLAFIPWSVLSALAGRLLAVRDFESLLVRCVLGFLAIMFGRWAIVLALLWCQGT